MWVPDGHLCKAETPTEPTGENVPYIWFMLRVVYIAGEHCSPLHWLHVTFMYIVGCRDASLYNSIHVNYYV